jgi:S1-C subfamily serine protease
MRYLRILTFLLILFVISVSAKAQSGLPVYWEKTVVLIEKEVRNNDGTIDTVQLGTGFIAVIDSTSGNFLVTNRHLLRNRNLIFIRFNKKALDPKKNEVRYYREPCPLIDKNSEPLWKGHPNDTVDVAAIKINLPSTVEVDIRQLGYWRLKSFDSLEVGEDVYFFGYPLGVLELKERGDFPILRSAVVSYKSFERTPLRGVSIDSLMFLIDGFAFEGNSGSPVLTRVIPLAKKKAQLVGIISGYISNRKQNVVGKDTITFEQNTGLAIAISADRIKETLEQFKIKEVPQKK